MYKIYNKVPRNATYGSLAIKLGMPRETISRILNGSQYCSKPYALAICSVLGIEFEDYFKKIK